MVRIYVSPSEANEDILGIALAAPIATLGANVLDKMLAKASASADSFTGRRLQAPQATTVGSGGIVAGATSLPLSSTLGYDSLDQQGVIIGSGATQETVGIVSGGVTVSSWVSPYPGTVTLTNPVTYSHSAGEAVQGCYIETSEAGSSSSSDVYTEAYTQEAEIALAHAPMIGRGGNLTRIVFTEQYPIIGPILKLEHIYPFASGNTYMALNANGVTINDSEGWLRIPFGSVVIPEGMIRTTYIGGFQTVGDDIKRAVMYYLADELSNFYNAQGALQVQRGKVNFRFSDGKSKPMYVQRAEDLLKRYKKTI